jgi:hypothetical protein
VSNPEEVFVRAHQGDVVRYQLRGPATPEEKQEVKEALEKKYPDLKFIVEADGAVSNAEVVDNHG